jgi:leucyl aminopeptidase (aminopeptidase T)
MMISAIDKIYEVNLGLKKGETVLVFTDSLHELDECARLVSERGKFLGFDVSFLTFEPTSGHGIEPPVEAWKYAFGENIVNSFEKEGILEKLLKKDILPKDLNLAQQIVADKKEEVIDVVIALSWYSTSHTNFRRLLTINAGTRYASMPLFSKDMFLGSMDVDWKEIEKISLGLKEIFSHSAMAEISANNGTALTLNLETRNAYADTGILTKYGDFGNLPAGEVYIAPLEGKAEGKLVIEYKETKKLKDKLTFEIKEGLVQEMSGDKAAIKEFEEIFNKNKLNRNIAELGIGTNPKAKDVTNVLEAEKILGTVHIALGDNSGFGGKVSTPFHEDFVVFSPTLKLKSKEGKVTTILKDGKFKVRIY